jgi:hypothetical protein
MTDDSWALGERREGGRREERKLGSWEGKKIGGYKN